MSKYRKRCGTCKYIEKRTIAGRPDRFVCGYPAPRLPMARRDLKAKWFGISNPVFVDDGVNCPCYKQHNNGGAE